VLERIQDNSDVVREAVRARYAAAASAVSSSTAQSGCCGSTSACCGSAGDASRISSNLYAIDELGELPTAAVLASLGCGNPTALAELQEGEVVLDLGSGGGIDVLLSARRVGPAGKAYGLDMTDEMLALARENQRKAGVRNVEFLKGDIEDIPLPDGSVDVIISNCVINLAADKERVLREAFRVLKPGGRFAVSDVVVRGEIPVEVRRSMELWVGCVAGALTMGDYESMLARAGFEQIGIEPTRVYHLEDARAFLEGSGLDVERLAQEVEGRIMGAFIRARKPVEDLQSEGAYGD
jgi:arsenite methyltransferase